MGLDRFHALLARAVLISSAMCLLLSGTALEAQCSDDNYRKTDKGWTFNRKHVDNADLATFRVLTGPDPYLGYIPCGHDSGYAIDRFHAYWHGEVISGADPRTFSYLRFDYSSDASHVYFRVAIVSGADPRTFTYIDRTYFKDSSHVYLRGAAIKEADAATFSLLGKSWYLEDRLARDGRHVFFGAMTVDEANSKDAVDLGGPYWRSNQTIFREGHPLKEADAFSFHVAPQGEQAFWAEDKTHYFLRTQTLEKSDCRRVGPTILACTTSVWIVGDKYSKLDPVSLHYLGACPIKHGMYEALPLYQDKRGVYFLDGNGILQRLLHSRRYPGIEHLDKSNADRLCHLRGTADIWPDGWFDQK